MHNVIEWALLCVWVQAGRWWAMRALDPTLVSTGSCSFSSSRREGSLWPLQAPGIASALASSPRRTTLASPLLQSTSMLRGRRLRDGANYALMDHWIIEFVLHLYKLITSLSVIGESSGYLSESNVWVRVGILWCLSASTLVKAEGSI